MVSLYSGLRQITLTENLTLYLKDQLITLSFASLLSSLRIKTRAFSSLTKVASGISVVEVVEEHRGTLTMRQVPRIAKVVTLAVSAGRIESLPPSP